MSKVAKITRILWATLAIIIFTVICWNIVSVLRPELQLAQQFELNLLTSVISLTASLFLAFRTLEIAMFESKDPLLCQVNNIGEMCIKNTSRFPISIDIIEQRRCVIELNKLLSVDKVSVKVENKLNFSKKRLSNSSVIYSGDEFRFFYTLTHLNKEAWTETAWLVQTRITYRFGSRLTSKNEYLEVRCLLKPISDSIQQISSELTKIYLTDTKKVGELNSLLAKQINNEKTNEELHIPAIYWDKVPNTIQFKK
jgi:hypothetical protein